MDVRLHDRDDEVASLEEKILEAGTTISSLEDQRSKQMVRNTFLMKQIKRKSYKNNDKCRVLRDKIGFWGFAQANSIYTKEGA